MKKIKDCWMAGIYKLNDIRGVVPSEINNTLMEKIGIFLADFIGKGKSIVIAGDSRLTTNELKKHLIKGLTKGGLGVYDLGIGPTPMIYFATNTNKNISGGIMITASHNPKEYNGIKVCDSGGLAYNYENLYSLIESAFNKNNFRQEIVIEPSEVGILNDGEKFADLYFKYLKENFHFNNPLKIALEFGNGSAGRFIEVLESLNCIVYPIREIPDGNFPSIMADPTNEKTYEELKKILSENQLDLGIAFDGDGDRVGFITSKNQYIISPDQIVMFYAQDIIERKKDSLILIDVKMSSAVNQFVESLGGRIGLSKTGHSWVHKKLIDTKAELAAELSCHYYFEDQYFGFDDGLYSALRLLRILDNLKSQNIDFEDKYIELPKFYSSKEYRDNISIEKQEIIIQELINFTKENNGKIIDIDGIRGEFDYGWFLVRSSGTEEALSYRIEGKREEDYLNLKNKVINIINQHR